MKKTSVSGARLIIIAGLLLATLTIPGSCSKIISTDYGNQPGPNEVFIQGTSYTPSPITITAGTTITWTNKDAVEHTVTSYSGAFDSGSISVNGNFSHLFTTAGTFPYYCTIHPSMTGSVIVK